MHLKQRRMLTFICSKCILRQLLSPQFCKCQTKFENTKGVSRSRKSKDHTLVKRNKTKGRKRSTKHYIENKRSSNTNPTKTVDELGCSGRVGRSCSTKQLNMIILLLTTNPRWCHPPSSQCFGLTW